MIEDEDDAGEEMFADLGRFEPGMIPVEAVLRRGKVIRLRRRLVGGGALVLAACLAVLAPMALRAQGEPGVEAASGPAHRITVDAPWQDISGQQIFAGKIDGKQWLYSRKSRCLGPETRCMDLVGVVLPPVSLLLEKTKDGNVGVSAEFGHDTDHAVMTVSHGEQFTVRALPVLTRNVVMINSAYFELPRGESVIDIAAYRADGSLIAKADPRPLRSNMPTPVPWYQPDGRVVSLVPPIVSIAQGGSGADAWSLDVKVGSYYSTYVYDAGGPSAPLWARGGELKVDIMQAPGSRAAVLYGETDLRTARVAVQFNNGETVSVTPVTFDGRSFAGTAAPFGVNILAVVQYDASGAVLPAPPPVFGEGTTAP